MRRFYHSTTLRLNEIVRLDDFAARHLVQVLRAKLDDKAILFNGDGHDYKVQIKSIDRNDVSVKVLEKNKNSSESPLKIQLYQALSTNEKMDWVIQKAVELGVHSITPILTQRSLIKLKDDKRNKKNQHWQLIALSACEQSGRSIIPKVNDIISLETCFTSMALKVGELRYLLNPYVKNSLKANKLDAAPDGIKLVIGPEGGFTENEVSFIESHDFKSVMLGPRILRTETAPIASIAILQSIYGDFV